MRLAGAALRRHRHDRAKRWLVLLLATLAVLCYAVAFFQPMWGFYLQSPQYPQGLVLSIRLTGVSGDVAEINTLNHYIGMQRLDAAAQLERQLAAYGVSGIGLVTMLLVFFPGRRYARYFTWPALAFPFVFIALSYLWMYRFGHELDPNAPIDIPPFTPTMLGKGAIGNFRTLGLPGPGFYLILASGVFVAAAFLLRRDVCSGCAARHSCGAVCPTLFIGRQRPADVAADRAERPGS